MTSAVDKPDDLPPYGPKMLALSTDKQRAFVEALFDEEAPLKGDGLLIFAARQAGYGAPDGSSTNKALGVMGTRLAHDKRVQAAIAEFSQQTLRAISPEAIMALKKVIRDPKHRDHMRAIAAIADRVDPIETKATVKIEDNRPPDIRATQEVLDRIEELARRAGIIAPAPQIIDGDYEVVGEGAPA